MKTSLLILAFAVSALSLSCAKHCIFPVPDGGVEKFSKPSMEIYIQDIQDNKLTVRNVFQYSNNGGNDYQVILTPETEIWGDYGGIVKPEALQKGFLAQIWLLDCKKPQKKGVNVAAVIWVHYGEYP